jgi:hypothetical protein
MSDLIFYTNNEETYRISFPTLGTKCPETKLEIKMTETDISKVLIEGDYATIMGVKYKRVEEPKTPVEEAYKEWWGQYPELETDSKYDDMRWQGFQAGYELAQVKDGCPEPPDEPDYYDEVEWDEKDNPKSVYDAVERLAKEYQAQKLYNILIKYGYADDVDEILDLVEKWLPKEQDASGSQNAYVECAVEGFNDCLTKIKGKLR